MPDYTGGRDIILQALKEELVGPSPQGREIDCTQPISFDEAKQSYGPWRQQGSGEEILLRDPPCKRYAVGVLYPLGIPVEEDSQDPSAAALMNAADPQTGDLASEEIVTGPPQQSIHQILKRESLHG